jgi:hypothetical protein
MRSTIAYVRHVGRRGSGYMECIAGRTRLERKDGHGVMRDLVNHGLPGPLAQCSQNMHDGAGSIV